MERWVGKVALVTGASTGIGAATAKELVRQGIKVIAIARREEKIQAFQGELKGAKGILYPRKADVTKEEDIVGLFQWIKKTFGTLHVLVNNAGVSRYGKYTQQNPKYWREIFDTNVIGFSICNQQAVKLMRETGVNDGHIVHMNSILGHFVPNLPDPILGVYPAGKAAVRALSEILRQELVHLKSDIRVTSISPALVRTELGDAANRVMEEHEQFDRESSFTPPGETLPILETQDVADAVVYCLSTPPNVQVSELILRPTRSNI